jgi:hypothetical protein
VAAKAKKELAALDKAVTKANGDLAKWANDETSFMGLEKPLFELKNPGLISIPLGFLGVLFGSLLSCATGAPRTCGMRCTRARTPACSCPSPSHIEPARFWNSFLRRGTK